MWIHQKVIEQAWNQRGMEEQEDQEEPQPFHPIKSQLQLGQPQPFQTNPGHASSSQASPN